MPGTYTYGLYPFPWDATARCHAPPAGSACVLDLRPLSEQAKASQSGGYGLFAWTASPPGDLVSLGTGYAPELLIDNAARNELRIKLGLASNPSGATLADAMADVLGSLADPSGNSMAKPIMPCSDGTLELHLDGHSRIWSAKIDAADVMSASPKGRHNRIRDVIRADLDIAERVGGVALLQKCLGAWLLKLGVSREELKAGAGGRKAQYDRLMSAAVKAKHGANARPEKPETQLVELWPSNGAITSGQTYTWAETVVSQWATGSTVSANRLGNTSNGSTVHGARCTTPVSSADHWSQGNLRVNGNYQAQLYSRMAAAAETGYAGGFVISGGTYCNFVTKYVAGTGTTLAVGPNINPTRLTAAALGKMRSNGSTQSFELAGFATLTATDTAITGNLYGGAGTVDAAVNHTNYVGPVTIDDGLNPPVAAFSGTPLSGLAPLSVAFTDASTNTPTSWLWERSSDGGSNWSTFSASQNPTAEFTAGTWAVRLTATNAGGSDAETKLAYVVVTAPSRKATAGSYGLGMYRGLGL